MKTVHFVVSGIKGPMGGADWPKQRPWVDHRFGIYRDFTFRSLQGQSEQDFLPVLMVNRRYKYARKVFGALEPEGLNLREWRTGTAGKADAWMLREAAKADRVYYTRVDTDDMLARPYIEFVRSQKLTNPLTLMMFRHGYCYQIEQALVGYWGWSLTPFYTLVMPSAMFVDRHAELIGTHRSIHKVVPRAGGDFRMFPRKEAPPDPVTAPYGASNMFCVGIHSKNTTSGMHGCHRNFLGHIARIRSWYPMIHEHTMRQHGCYVRVTANATERYGYVHGELQRLEDR